jgi:KDO2-lipid IV(A) lauroyltransferase
MSISHFLQWQPNVFLYRRLGWSFACNYLFFLGSLYYLFKASDREKIALSVGNAFGDGKEALDMRRLQARIVRGILSHYFEKILNAYRDVSGLSAFLKDCISAPSLPKLDEALKHHNGVLFVTGHYGGIEYIPIFLALHHYPVSVVFKCATKQLKKKLHSRAEELGIRVIDPEKGNTVGAVLKNLKANRIVFIECDEIQAWRPSQTERMTFLGREIGVDRTLNLLQKRSGATMVFGILQRFDLKTYALVIETYEEILPTLRRVPSSAAAAFLKHLERYIYAYPDEWYQWKPYADMYSSHAQSKPGNIRALVPVLKPSLKPAS